MSELFVSVEMLGAKMDMNVKNLENKMNDGFKTERVQRKQDYENLEEQIWKKI